MTKTMSFAIFTPAPSLLHPSSSSSPYTRTRQPSLFASVPKNSIFNHAAKSVPQLGFALLSQWNGLKQMGISISHYSVKMEKKGRKRKGKGGINASLFGVGAPEALVVGVVALLVFGPKGLAEVARNLGKTLRGFQPTIRELQEVSREFKSTLEREIGLDDIKNPAPSSYMSNTPRPTPQDFIMTDESSTFVEPKLSVEDEEIPSPSENELGGAYTADEYLKVTEEQLKGAFARLQNEQSQLQTPSQDTSQEPSRVMNISENSESNALQEGAATVSPPAPAPKN
ncbi:hypothetical protein ABFX02_06G108100 [Erythranthe guttata]